MSKKPKPSPYIRDILNKSVSENHADDVTLPPMNTTSPPPDFSPEFLALSKEDPAPTVKRRKKRTNQLDLFE